MSLLVAIIYLAFISLGLPDSLLGSGWPVMSVELGASLSSAGIISFIISASTIVSALFSDKITRKIGTGKVTAFSVLLTALAMMGFSFGKNLATLCILAVPYGLGAGAIDACLNNYVALHLSPRQMSWLHCFWGVGAVASPYIMSYAISTRLGWQGGYRTVSVIQLVLTVIMFLAIPMWNKAAAHEGGEEEEEPVSLSIGQIFKIPGTVLMFVSFLLYCAIENMPIVWASSYFSSIYSLDAEKAASLASLFYIGMTGGRAICGIFANKLGDKQLIRMGIIIILFGAIISVLPVGSYICAAIGFVIIGLGCSPIYPAFVHSTPSNFSRKYSQSIIGVQMAFAYVGMTVTPIIFGKLAEYISISILPYGVFSVAVIILITTELLNKKVADAKA
jgi:MFS family permease